MCVKQGWWHMGVCDSSWAQLASSTTLTMLLYCNVFVIYINIFVDGSNLHIDQNAHPVSYEQRRQMKTYQFWSCSNCHGRSRLVTAGGLVHRKFLAIPSYQSKGSENSSRLTVENIPRVDNSSAINTCVARQYYNFPITCLLVFMRDNPLAMLGEHEKTCKSLAFGSWFTNFSSGLPTSLVDNHAG